MQNQPGSDLDGLVRIWPNSSAPEASWCTRFIRPGSGRVQPAHYQFPTFRLSSVLPQTAQMILCKTSPDQDRIITSLDHIVQNQPGSSLVLADCVRLWPNGSCPEASQCARIFWFASEVNQIWKVYSINPCRVLINLSLDDPIQSALKQTTKKKKYTELKNDLKLC